MAITFIDQSFEFYTYGNNAAVVQLFSGIASIIGNGDYGTLLKIFIILGFTVFTIGLAFGSRLEKTGGYFFGIVLAWSLLFSLRANVIVVDRTVGTTASPTVVANVPYGLAVAAHMTSKTGDWLTTTLEAAFSLSDNHKYQGNGLLVGNKVLDRTRELSMARAFGSEMENDWTLFMHNCAYYDMGSYGKYTRDELENSANPLEVLGKTNRSMPTPITTNGRQEVVMCNAAYTTLKARMDAGMPNLLAKIARWIYPSPNISDLAAQTQADAVIADTYGTFLKMGQDTRTIIQNQAVLNMMNMSGQKTAALMNDAGQMTQEVAKIQSIEQLKNSYRLGGNTGMSVLPKIRNVIEAIILGLFPLMLLLVFLAPYGSSKVLLSYAQALFWIQLWAPLYAVLNLYQTDETKQAVQAIASGGFSYMNMVEAQVAVLKESDVAAQMVWAIPVIAMAIVKTGDFLVGAAFQTAAASASGSASQAAATSQTTGNWSFSNMSTENMNANSQQSMWRSDGGLNARQWMDSHGTTHTQAADGNHAASVLKNDFGGMRAVVSESQVAGFTQKAGTAAQLARTNTHAASNQIGQSWNQLDSTTKSKIRAAAESNGMSKNEMAALEQSWQKQSAQQTSAGTDHTTQVGRKTELGGGAGIGGGGANASASIKGGVNASKNEAHTSGQTFSASEQVSASNKFTENLQSNREFRESVTGALQGAKSTSSGASRAATLLNTAGIQLAQSETYAQEATLAKQKGTEVSVDLTAQTNDTDALYRAYLAEPEAQRQQLTKMTQDQLNAGQVHQSNVANSGLPQNQQAIKQDFEAGKANVAAQYNKDAGQLPKANPGSVGTATVTVPPSLVGTPDALQRARAVTGAEFSAMNNKVSQEQANTAQEIAEFGTVKAAAGEVGQVLKEAFTETAHAVNPPSPLKKP